MRRVLTTLEVLLILATIGFCAAWILVPDRIWEPLIVLLGTLLLLVEFLKRRPRQITTANRFESNGKRIKHREILRKVYCEGRPCRSGVSGAGSQKEAKCDWWRAL